MSEKDEKERDTKEEEPDNDESKHSDEALDASPETDTNDNKIPEVTQNHVTDDTAATIGHDEIHVDITRKAKESDDNVIDDVDGSGNKDAHVITTQPTVVYGYDQGAYIQDNGSRIVTQGPKKPKPKDFVVTSCFVVLCCNFIFGLLGYHFGVKANHAWQLGDEPAARSRAKLALIMVICGIIAGLATYALAFGLYFSTRSDDHAPDVQSHNMAG